jgi:5-methylcytosine-specific restriction endonuclease McrA
MFNDWPASASACGVACPVQSCDARRVYRVTMQEAHERTTTTPFMATAERPIGADPGSGGARSASITYATPGAGDSRVGRRCIWRGAMSRQSLHRIALPRTPRGLRRQRTLPRRGEKQAIKRATMRDCGRRCVYCGQCLDLTVATLDHVYPLAHGGAHAPGNLVVACGRCNRLKGDMLPHEFFARYPIAGLNFLLYARVVHRALKRNARKAVSLAMAA